MTENIQSSHLCGNTCITVKIVGKSMSPILRDGVSATVTLCSIMDIHRGDIVVYKDGTGFTAHRVMGKVCQSGKQFLKAKGDIDFRYDNLIGPEYILGKIEGITFGTHSVNINNLPSRIIGFVWGYVTPVLVHAYFCAKNLMRYNACSHIKNS